MNPLRMLGTGLLKKEKRLIVTPEKSLTGKEKNAQRAKRAASVENFLREILGTHLIQLEKKF